MAKTIAQQAVCAVFLVALITAGLPVRAEEAKLGKDDFISSAVSDVFEKVGQYTSGEKRIVTEDAKGVDDLMGYKQDPLEGQLPKPPRKTGLDAALNEPL